MFDNNKECLTYINGILKTFYKTINNLINLLEENNSNFSFELQARKTRAELKMLIDDIDDGIKEEK